MDGGIKINNCNSDGNILTIQTVQIAPFRTLMTALKDILLETNISFQPDGIRIINMDKSHTILAHLFLDAKNFEFYECKKDKIIIGVNMLHLFKLINTIDNGDITFENIVEKMELMKILILELQSDLKQDYTIEKERTEIRGEIMRIRMRLNNYQNKYDRWLAEIKIHF